MSRLPLIVFVLSAAGCMPAADAFAPDAGPTVDQSAVLASVANGAHRHDPRFTQVSGAPYPSAIAPTSTLNVWVSASAFADYAKIAPEKTGSGATVAAGTMIVREVLDATGAVAKLTLMMKGPAGYNPTVGDFWFGVTQPDGTPIVDSDSGQVQMGKLDQCFGCHQGRASDGFLFGVPEATAPAAPCPSTAARSPAARSTAAASMGAAPPTGA